MDIVKTTQIRLDTQAEKKNLLTGDIRKISAQLFKELPDKNIDTVLSLSENLLESRKPHMWLIAYDWAYRVQRQYNDDTFLIFERWLKKYISDWYDCDDFCTHALGCLVAQQNKYFDAVKTWTKHPNFAVRRAAAVSLIYPINHEMYKKINPYAIADTLMHDENYLVLKGYGWMLKVLSQKEPLKVIEYLLKNKYTMPRVAYRYALEKYDKKTRDKLMK